MLTAAVDAVGIGGELDAVLSVDTIRRYKPLPEVYALVTQRFGITPPGVVFVSSNRWDVMGVASFGFRTAWINLRRCTGRIRAGAGCVAQRSQWAGGDARLRVRSVDDASRGSILSRKTSHFVGG